MKLDIWVANPAGNITIFVKNEVMQENYLKIANKLLEIEKYQAEQVAFAKNLAHEPFVMEMMGLEFCGNATRSFGYLAAKENNYQTPCKVVVDVSGSANNLEVMVDYAKQDAIVAMSAPKDIVDIKVNDQIFSMVIMEGISHVIIKQKEFDEALSNNILSYVLANYEVDALGLMFVDGSNMYPVVYVVQTDTLIHEGSCGSGSIAYAYYQFHNKDGEHTIDIKQPGGTLTIKVVNNETKECYLGGMISLSELETVEIEL